MSNAKEESAARHFVVKPAPRLTSSGNAVSDSNDDDQPVLMEAKLLETISSLRALIKSNWQLEHAIRECHDDELVQALQENDVLIARKHGEAAVLAAKLSRHGVNISLADKIPQYDGSKLLREMKEREKNDKRGEGGMYL
ncbi:hypothetical protein ACHAXT_005707 [Thalassiosira profunda]